MGCNTAAESANVIGSPETLVAHPSVEHRRERAGWLVPSAYRMPESSLASQRQDRKPSGRGIGALVRGSAAAMSVIPASHCTLTDQCLRGASALRDVGSRIARVPIASMMG